MRTLAGRWQRFALGIVLILTLTGCVLPLPPAEFTYDPPVSCDSFTELHWREFTFGLDSTDDVNDVVAKIVRLWALDSDQVQIESMEEKVVSIRWQGEFHDGTAPRYSAYFHEDAKLSGVVIDWWDRQPTLALVIDCLGFPEHYAAYYMQEIEARSMTIDLWYTKKGFVITSYFLHGDVLPPEIRPYYRMVNFVVTTPGEPEQMLLTMYDHDPDVLAGLLCLIKPWPGSIEAMEVDSFFDSDPRCTLR